MSEGLFLGRTVEGDADVRLQPDHLRTHALIVGMTGSGKTGLGLVLLEELAMAGVPVIAVDPKGDLGNLALLFPELSAAEFEPWVEQGGSAEGIARVWRDGLARWGMGPADVLALRRRLELSIWTPGSDAGVPVDVLGSFRRPPAAELDDEEGRLALVTSTVSGLLGLVGRGGDPVRDPAHVVLQQVLDAAWTAGEDPDLETLILRLVDPPFEKVGVFPVDLFFPPDDRMALAMSLNALVAAPSFASWTRGAPLDVEQMLAPRDGRTPVTVLSVAHLSDAQRQFVLTLLLGRLHAWSRRQPGTSALRALLYFDEVAGYLPPHPHDPPTKTPLLSMMKQARAVGLGIVLATQNPVDVDYKAMSNAGVWSIGRLQTRQDRDRLLKGLGRPDLDDVVEGLDGRCFVLHDARAEEPVVLRSRFARCYLRGPLTRVEIERLRETGATRAAAPTPGAAIDPDGDTPARTLAPTAAAGPAGDGLLATAPPVPGDSLHLDPRVVLSARLADTFGAHAEPARDDGAVVFRPALYARLALRFDEDRVGFVLDHAEHRVWFPLGERLPDEPLAVPLQDADELPAPPPGARYEPLPAWLDEGAELEALRTRIVDDVYRSETRGMFAHPALKLYGRPGETREQFEARCRKALVARVHEQVGKLEGRYDKKVDQLETRIRGKERTLEELEGTLRSRRTEEVVNVGETVLGMFFGRKKRLTSAVSKRRQTMRSRERLERTEDEIADLQAQAVELQDELADEIATLQAREEALLGEIEEREVRLEKNDIRVERFGVLWVPVTRRI